MKRLNAIACAFVLLATAGCGSQTAPGTSEADKQTDQASGAAATLPAETTPTPLSDKEAGEVYLDGVCPRNALVNDLYELVDATWIGDQTGYYDTAQLDLKKAKTLAAKQRDANRAAVDEYEETLWPEDVQEAVDQYVEGVYLEMSWLNGLASSSSSDAFVTDFADSPALDDTSAASQKIRAKLGISADAQESCKKR